ncbi:MAG: hypothetical protein JF597_03125 [Streptomyces sp.]|uniref:hypothetical protein n=1 Tax=Streptomyces sp. TaxID=1931 RepID=UPI0025FBC8A5|nr:hypothetical protein [Streptomyces sp.]MBW8792604.1 hypothetical protein [Streptomyces sp.]
MMRELFNAVVDTDFGQFDLLWGDETDYLVGCPVDWDDGHVNGFVGAGNPHGLHLCMARPHGASPVVIELHAEEPAVPPPSFEDVVEVSIVIPPEARVTWFSWGGETSGELPTVPGGSYRVRVCCQGRDEAAGEVDIAEAVIDLYVIQLWLAPPAPENIVRIGTEDARRGMRDLARRQQQASLNSSVDDE